MPTQKISKSALQNALRRANDAIEQLRILKGDYAIQSASESSADFLITRKNKVLVRVIKGPEGEVGRTGLTGTPGLSGNTGKKGIKGDQGVKGLQGLRGYTGNRGETGKTGEFGTVGGRGEQGERGICGGEGKIGPKGVKGEHGIPGIQGLTGNDGEKGDIGLRGVSGLTGDAGKQGERGSMGVSGLRGDTGEQGELGDAGEKGDIGDMPKHKWEGTVLRFQIGLDRHGHIKYEEGVDLRGLTIDGTDYLAVGSPFAFGVKSDGTQVGKDDINVFDFSTAFTITESPDKTINVGLVGGGGGYTDAEAILAVEGEPTLDLTGIVTFADDLIVDTDVFFVDPGNRYIGFGTVATNANNQLHILMTATKDILIDGTTNPREVDTGVMRFEQTPAIENTRAITVNVDANSQANTHAMVVNMVATQIVAGESLSAYDVVAIKGNSTGGVVRGYEMSLVGTGGIAAQALHANPNVSPIHQDSGSFGNVEQAWLFDDSGSSWTDATAAFNDINTDVTIFAENNDVVYIGMASAFDHIEFILTTAASGAGIKPAFAFSNDGVGGFAPFMPSDDTIGFRQSGIVGWETPDLTNWQTDTVNGTTNKFWVRITRTQVSISTPPVEYTVQVQAVTEYKWDALGDLTINAMSMGDDLDLNLNELLDAKLENLGSLPGAGNLGRIIYLTTDSHLYIDQG